jgi:ABC-type multidrug transport system fused ATPase/permease subunit
MNIIKNIWRLLFVMAIVLFFINWKIALIVLGVWMIFFEFERWPSFVLNAISWYISFCGVIFLYVDFKIWLFLLIIWFLVTVFRIKWDKSNNIYYWIMEVVKKEHSLNSNMSNPYLFQNWSEWKYKIEFKWEKYNIYIKEDWKFNWIISE